MWNLIYHGEEEESIVDRFRTLEEAKEGLRNRVGLCQILHVNKITDIYSIKKGTRNGSKRLGKKRRVS